MSQKRRVKRANRKKLTQELSPKELALAGNRRGRLALEKELRTVKK